MLDEEAPGLSDTLPDEADPLEVDKIRSVELEGDDSLLVVEDVDTRAEGLDTSDVEPVVELKIFVVESALR